MTNIINYVELLCLVKLPKSPVLQREEIGQPIFRLPDRFPTEWQGKLVSLLGRQLIRVLSKGLWFPTPTLPTIRLREAFITTPDGAKLATDIYLPRVTWKNKAKAPTILVRMPYWKDSAYCILGRLFAGEGYVAVFQDIRGCAHSSPYGTNSLWLSEREDGLTTLKWICRQFWYNGRIGTWGTSYFGMTQWAISWDNEGLITCINPCEASYHSVWQGHQGLGLLDISSEMVKIMENVGTHLTMPPHDFLVDRPRFISQRMVLDPRFMLYNDPPDFPPNLAKVTSEEMLGKTIGERERLLNDRLNMDIHFNKRDIPTYYALIHRSFLTREYLQWGKYDAMCKEFDPRQVTQPVFIFAGWYDMFFEHSLQDFLELRSKVPAALRDAIRIVIGPWGHAVLGRLGLRFNRGGLGDMFRHFIPMQYFDHYLKDQSNGWEQEPPIKIFVMGKDEWRGEQEWPPARAQQMKWYLHSKGHANTKYGNGQLSESMPGEEPPDKFDFDPLHPVLTTGGPNLGLQKGMREQKRVETRPDVIIFTSAPLREGIEVTGPVMLSFFAASSAVDTDFMAKLCDVYPNGKSYNIVDAGIRARFRNGEVPELLIPGEIYPFEIVLGNTANYFAKGHCLRLELTSSNFPRFDLNANLGGQPNPRKCIVAQQTIYHDAEHPSCLHLPIIKE
jgi:hypothetical protein